MLCSCVPVKSVEMAASYYSNVEDKPVKDEYYANNNRNDIWGGKLAKEIGLEGNVRVYPGFCVNLPSDVK